MISETGWTWDEVRGVLLRRFWLLFAYWARRDGPAPVPPPPSEAEIAAALMRMPWKASA